MNNISCKSYVNSDGVKSNATVFNISGPCVATHEYCNHGSSYSLALSRLSNSCPSIERTQTSYSCVRHNLLQVTPDRPMLRRHSPTPNILIEQQHSPTPNILIERQH